VLLRAYDSAPRLGTVEVLECALQEQIPPLYGIGLDGGLGNVLLEFLEYCRIRRLLEFTEQLQVSLDFAQQLCIKLGEVIDV